MKLSAAKVVVFVLLGAIVNIAVAWGCALRVRGMVVDAGGLAMSTKGAEAIPFVLGDFVRRSMEVPESVSQYDLFGWEWRGRGMRMLRVSRWIGYNALPDNTGNYRVERESGWPLLALHGQRRENSEMYWAVSVPEGWSNQPIFRTFSGPSVRAVFVPTKPLWPGFAINTIFYAGVLWMMFAFPFVVRRYIRGRRIKRGLCPACAYPVGTSPVCTECGKARSC